MIHAGRCFHSKDTWGCAALKGIIFWTSSQAKGIFAVWVSHGLARDIIHKKY